MILMNRSSNRRRQSDEVDENREGICRIIDDFFCKHNRRIRVGSADKDSIALYPDGWKEVYLYLLRAPDTTKMVYRIGSPTQIVNGEVPMYIKGIIPPTPEMLQLRLQLISFIQEHYTLYRR